MIYKDRKVNVPFDGALSLKGGAVISVSQNKIGPITITKGMNQKCLRKYPNCSQSARKRCLTNLSSSRRTQFIAKTNIPAAQGADSLWGALHWQE